MSYTKEQLEVMSDKEINIALARKINGEPWLSGAKVSDGKCFLLLKDEKENLCMKSIDDYCGNWSVIMPLAVEYGVNVNPNAGSAVSVLKPDISFRFCKDDTPKAQRAIACCLLMMEL